MSAGAGIFSRAMAAINHLVKPGGGISGEVFDLRKDIAKELGIMAGFVAEEWTNAVGLAAPGAAVLLVATASVASPVTIATGGLLAAGRAMLAAQPRQLTFTTAGTTPADAPDTVTITGTDANDAVQSETLSVSQTAAAVTSVKLYKTITSIVYPAGQGTGATVSIGIAAAVILKAFATTVAPVTYTRGQLVQTCLADQPRALVFTTAGGTPAHAPANVVITGADVNGNVQSETLALAQTNTTATSTKFYSRIDTLAFPAGDGTAGTIAVTFGAAIGLKRKIRSRAGLIATLKEVVNGAVVTNGTFAAPSTTDLPNGSYTPNSAPNDVSDYAIVYEADFTAP